MIRSRLSAVQGPKVPLGSKSKPYAGAKRLSLLAVRQYVTAGYGHEMRPGVAKHQKGMGTKVTRVANKMSR
jgi:hypothetical protein